MEGKIKLLVCGDGVVSTGFSRVLHSIIENLPKEKYSIKWIAVNYYGDPHKYDLEIYPASLRGDLYGLHRLPEFVSWKPDIIFILNDAWIVDSYLKEIQKVFTELPKIVTYIPVDAEDHDKDWYSKSDIITKIVAYTNFGKHVIEEATCNTVEDIRIIPHGINSSTFYKIDKDKARQQLFGDKYEELKDAFIFLSANRNQPRKKLDITLQAFAHFVMNKEDNIRLYMHCGNKDSAIDVLKLARRYGIENRLINSNMKNGPQQVGIDKLNLIYNASDVGLNTSVGEGWSLTNMEHAVTGAPQVLARHSALAEVFSDCNVMVEPSMAYVLDGINTTGYLVSPVDFSTGLELIYTNKEVYKQLSEANILKFTNPEYQWKNISKQWDALFNEVLENANNVSK